MVNLFIGKPFVDVREFMLGEGGFSCLCSLLINVCKFVISLCVVVGEGFLANIVCEICMREVGVSMSFLAPSFASAYSDNLSVCFDFLYCCFLVGQVNLVHFACDK